jgi:hypothetical protein
MFSTISGELKMARFTTIGLLLIFELAAISEALVLGIDIGSEFYKISLIGTEQS